ncbi:nickel and cobalt resistance protein CnrA [bacterium BMS3Bbin07]|nr:nickel and cobalt resistance protein CnrA [bacterium BMS3Bbin07]
MKRVVRYTIRQAVFLNIVFVLFIVAGIFSLFTTPVENMPPVDMGRVFITTVYYGASADDVESLVTSKIEDALDGIKNVEDIQSRSLRNYSTVEVKFIDDTDYRALYDELRFRVLNIKNELPPGADEPLFMYADTQMWMPVVAVNIVGDIPSRSLKLLAGELKAGILDIPGVREVTLSGEYEKEFHVSLDPEKLRRFGITFDQVAEAVGSANTKIPTGRFREDSTEFMLEAGSRLSSQQEVLDVVVRRDGDANFLRVGDLVTSAAISYRDPDVISSTNGLNTLRLLVKKEDSGNSIRIAEAVKDLSRRFEKTHGRDGVTIEFTNDSTIEIKDSVRTLSGNMLFGMVLVTIVLWITLGFRNAMLTAIGIPFSFLCAIILIKITGQSINTISLFSFVLVSGIIVDDAVIILENVYRHMQMGKSSKEAVIDGVSEVMLPVISSSLTTILAFVPMLIMSGSTGDFFSVIPKAVSYALAASLFEALFILPIHILDWGPKRIKQPTAEKEEHSHHLTSAIFAPLWRLYRRILDILLEHKAATMVSISGLFLLALLILGLSVTGIVPLINVKFFPGSYFRYHLAVIMPAGTSIERTDAVVRDLSRFIVSMGKKQALATSGAAGFYEDEDYSLHSGHRYGQVVVTLPEEKERDFPENPGNDLMLHLDYIREKVNDFIDRKYGGSELKPYLKVFPENTGPPTGKAVNIRISGNTMGEVVRAADSLKQYLGSDEEFSDLQGLDDNRATSQRVVKYIPMQEAVFEYGLTPRTATSLVAGALNGRYAGEFRSRGEEVALLVRLARADDPGNSRGTGISEPADILDVPVIENSSSPVLLRDLVEMKYLNEPTIRTRYNGKPTITISSDIKSGANLSTSRVQVLVKRFFENIAGEHPGVTISFGGEFESTKRAYTSLVFAFFIALLCIYMVLSSQFKDYFQPVIIISAVAFALIGVVFGMLITRSTFTIGSFLAVVGLAGVAVNDSLILIDFMNRRRRAGAPLREAVIEACSVRMRPVLITTVTTMLGLLPMAIGIPSKSIAWAPMATAFVTGLSSATLLTLLIVPVEYELSEALRLFLRRVTGRHDKEVQT